MLEINSIIIKMENLKDLVRNDLNKIKSEEFEENNCIDHYAHYDKDFTSNTKSTISTSEIIERTSSEEDTLQKRSNDNFRYDRFHSTRI